VAGTSLYSVYRRTARAAAQKRVVKQTSSVDIARARTDFAYFCDVVGDKPPAAHHLEWHKHLCTDEDSVCLKGIAGPNIDILAPRGPLAVSMPVATPHGWRPIGELALGDLVFAEDGSSTEIIDIHDYAESPTWNVIFSDGSSVVCDDQHLWKVRRVGTDEKGTWRLMTLNDIRTQKTTGLEGNWRTGVKRVTETCKEGSAPWLDSRGYARYQIPITEPVQYPKSDLIADPYLLGVLIGDGGMTKKSSILLTSADKDIVDRCGNSLPPGHELVSVFGSKYGYKIVKTNREKNKPNKVLDALRTLGLQGKGSIEKFIPSEYKFACVEDRIALLQGLLDTDGTVGSNRPGGGKISFCSASYQLILDVVELVQSLGGVATINAPQYNQYNSPTGEKIRTTNPSWKVGIKLPPSIKPFYLQRKALLYKPCTKYLPCRSIVDIKPALPEKVRCITVAHEKHTFLTKDYIVSKNSAKSSVLGLFTAWTIGVHALHKMPLKILYISYTIDVARPKSAAIKRIIEESKTYNEIFPMVKIAKGINSNEYWSIDWKFAGIKSTGEEEFTVCCAGLKGAVTSKRSHLCIIDDICKSADEIKNRDIRTAMEDNWNSVIVPTMFEGGRAICLGTRFRHDDMHGTTFIPANDWVQLVQSAIVVDQEGEEISYWPDMWSLEYLQDRRRQAPIAFSFQYQNQIVQTSELSLSPDLIVKGTIATQFDAMGVGVDLSAGVREQNDYTAFVMGGRVKDKIHIIDCKRIRIMGNLEKLEALMEMMEEWGVIHKDGGRYFPTGSNIDIWSEAVAYQASLEADFKRICLGDHGLYNMHWHAVKGFRGDKVARFRGIMGLFEQRKLIFNKYRRFGPLTDEIINFGVSSHDDTVDALVWLCNGLMTRGKLELAF
jgi:hypothetical protein